MQGSMRGQEWSTAAGPLAAKYNAQRLRLMTGEMPSCTADIVCCVCGRVLGPKVACAATQACAHTCDRDAC